jgi:hypothetical protein
VGARSARTCGAPWRSSLFTADYTVSVREENSWQQQSGNIAGAVCGLDRDW